MTNKELIQILKRFPKTAAIEVDGNKNFFISASLNELGEWTVQLTADNERNANDSNNSTN